MHIHTYAQTYTYQLMPITPNWYHEEVPYFIVNVHIGSDTHNHQQ